MAFALPGAIGAQIAYPDRPVVAITGDGGFAMLMADLVTAARYDLPITVVVFNNEELGFIGLEQEAKGYPKHSIELQNPDFVKVAEASGAQAWRVDRAEDLEEAFRQALASNKPAFVEVMVDRNELVMPPKITFDQAFNFGISKARELVQ